jgi:hypothetical protein
MAQALCSGDQQTCKVRSDVADTWSVLPRFSTHSGLVDLVQSSIILRQLIVGGGGWLVGLGRGLSCPK